MFTYSNHIFLYPNFYTYPFSHYYIVVMNVTENSPIPLDTINDDQLKPYSGPEFVYIAAVLTSDEYDPSQPYTLGSFTYATFFEGLTYINVPLTVGRYHCFVCAFTIGPVSE